MESPDASRTPTVTFLPSGTTVVADVGETILDIALHHGVPLGHDCGGNCACTTCHVRIVEGSECLSVMEEVEAQRLRTAENHASNSRLGCQALLLRGHLVVTIPSQ